ncbi:MAG: protein kinase family protein [Acidipropionibacterium sp.]|nr:protein kinase family protein [Acidipropionibacterium sp.]
MDRAFDNRSSATLRPSSPQSSWPDDAEPQDPVPSLSAGDQLGGRFRLEQELGRPLGTMTWRAFDLKLHRPVLMHIMSPSGAHTDEVLAAARRAAVATDSRFLRVLDAVAAGPDDPGSFVVCEFAPGRSISELLQSGPLSALEAAWIIRELADAMAPLHSQGLFHERLNPDNVIVTSTGNVKIVGLLIQAALHPWPGDQALTWADREARDVSDMGRLLYACLVSRWPAGTARHPRPSSTRDGRVRWGLVPAPADDHGWLPPRQVRAGVSPALDTLCDQILSEVPRHDEVPIRTANEVAQALTRVLGSADAAADLERRLRYPTEEPTRTRTVIPPSSDRGPRAGDAATLRQPAVGADGLPLIPAAQDDDGTGTSLTGLDEDGYWTPEAAAGEWAHVPARSGRDGSEEAGEDTAPGDDGDPAAPAGRRNRSTRRRQRPRPAPIPVGHLQPEEVDRIAHNLAQPRPASRRWQAWMIAGVAVILLVCLVMVGLRRGSGADAPVAGASSQATTVTIDKVDDFDPAKDGGNDEENPNLVAKAWDGNPRTAWTTLVYRGSPKLGMLKPGVGLVVDLGEATRVSSVTVTLVHGATDVALYVPKASGSQPPMSSIADWRRVAGMPGAKGASTLKPASPVSTRFLLVYLTRLPKVSEGRYQGGIAEIKVTP